jgi:hypothetical protein
MPVVPIEQPRGAVRSADALWKVFSFRSVTHEDLYPTSLRVDRD